MVEYRQASTLVEIHACVNLQQKVWGSDPLDIVPFNQLHVANSWGGHVHIAVDDGNVVGFCYGFAGRQFGRPALLSHMLGVLPGYRGRQVGLNLKLAQGRWALANGFDLITWTYDPLEAVNAHLNIARLGGSAKTYLVNHYGEMTDGLNAGLPSDRLLVEWHVGSPRIGALLAGDGLASAPTSERVCQVPRSFQQIKTADPEAALAWRLQVREELVKAFADGYVISGFHLEDGAGTYHLTRGIERQSASGY